MLLAKPLSIRHRLVVYMTSFNIMPRLSSLNEVRTLDLHLLHKMLYGLGEMKGILLACIIIDYVKEVTRTKRTPKYLYFQFR